MLAAVIRGTYWENVVFISWTSKILILFAEKKTDFSEWRESLVLVGKPPPSLRWWRLARPMGVTGIPFNRSVNDFQLKTGGGPVD